MSHGNNPPIGGDDVSAIVVDIGSHTTRVGYGQEDTPKQFWNSYAGKPVGDTDDRASSNFVFPLNFFEKQEALEAKPCIFSNGAQYDIDSDVFETIVRSTVEGRAKTTNYSSDFLPTSSCGATGGLGVRLRDHPVLLTEPSRHSVSVRERMAETLFEVLEVPALYVAKRAMLSAFASGRANALVVDIGSSGMTVGPVFEGHCLQKCLHEYPIGGDLLDTHLSACLEEHTELRPRFAYEKVVRNGQVAEIKKVRLCRVHPTYIQLGTQEVVRTMRETVCRVASEGGRDCGNGRPSYAEADDTANSTSPATYELPDGKLVDTSKYRYSVGEVLFQPQLIKGVSPASLGNFRGIPQAIVDCILTCDVDLRKDLLGAILLTGGTSLTPGLSERLGSTIQTNPSFAFRASKLRLVVPTASVERRFACWLGGSILASLGTFQQLWISREEHQEYGSSILERRCH